MIRAMVERPVDPDDVARLGRGEGRTVGRGPDLAAQDAMTRAARKARASMSLRVLEGDA